LLFQFTESDNKRERRSSRKAGNCFEANLIHPGGPGYLEAAQKSRLGFIKIALFFQFKFFKIFHFSCYFSFLNFFVLKPVRLRSKKSYNKNKRKIPDILPYLPRSLQVVSEPRFSDG
jgi:hypothetical protein